VIAEDNQEFTGLSVWLGTGKQYFVVHNMLLRSPWCDSKQAWIFP